MQIKGPFLVTACLALLAVGEVAADDAVERGREIAKEHCTRCHVVADINPYGGINSTPSFVLLARRDDYNERFSSFYERRPHPVFVRLPGVEKWTDIPSPVAEFELTHKDVENIVAYIEFLRAQQ